MTSSSRRDDRPLDELERCRNLVEASYALHTTLDLDELLGLILETAKSGVDADRGTVFLLCENGKELWSRLLTGDGDLEIRLPVGQGIAGTVAETGETVRLSDAHADPRFDHSWDRRTGYRTQQLLTAPIRNRDGRVIGVFQLLNKRSGTFDETDEEYLAALSIHTSLAVENARLHRSALEKERQDREIALVRDIQRAYLPERTAKQVGTFDVAALNLLCEDASGDYYDALELPDGRLLLAVGDVAGHGLGAALVMAQARAILRAFATTVAGLPDVLGRMNDSLAADMSQGRFMSLFVTLADARTGRLEWNNAGHPPGFLLRAATGEVERLMPHGRILGVLPDATYRTPPSTRMEPGDVLLLYTDGATEARNQDEVALDDAGLARVLEKLANRDPEDVIDGILEALVGWTGADVFEDDLTLVVLKRKTS